MKNFTLLVLLLISFASGYDKYLKDKKVYLCKTLECRNDYGFGKYILETLEDSLDEYIDFVNAYGVDEEELVAYNQSYPWGKRNRNKPPKFRSDFPAEYYIVLRVKIDSAYAANKPTTFSIVDPTLRNVEYANFTIGNDDKLYHQYYVSIEVSIYTTINGVLYYYMSNENDSHEEEDVFEKEIKYNIDECIEDFPDKFNETSTWRYYKNLNKGLFIN